MIEIRKSKERGHFDFGWLNTHHTFSFADYHDPKHMGFRSLRVINDDWIAEGKGFGTHPHKDMEIITYVLEGAVAHKDSMGNGSTIQAGEIQYMSAGTGVTHSEFNPLPNDRTHLFQIWILPSEAGQKPRYDQKLFRDEDKKGKWKVVASGAKEGDAIQIRQDAKLSATILKKGEKLDYVIPQGRYAWVQLVRGNVSVNGKPLKDQDGAAVSEEKSLKFEALDDSEILLFDLN